MTTRPNYKTFKKEIDALQNGERVFINAINLSINGINALREYIQNGVLIPDREEVQKAYKDIDAVMTGSVIIPQMDYTKSMRVYTQEETQFIIEAAHGSAAEALGQEFIERNNGDKFTSAIFWKFKDEEETAYKIHQIYFG